MERGCGFSKQLLRRHATLVRQKAVQPRLNQPECVDSKASGRSARQPCIPGVICVGIVSKTRVRCKETVQVWVNQPAQTHGGLATVLTMEVWQHCTVGCVADAMWEQCSRSMRVRLIQLKEHVLKAAPPHHAQDGSHRMHLRLRHHTVHRVALQISWLL